MLCRLAYASRVTVFTLNSYAIDERKVNNPLKLTANIYNTNIWVSFYDR